MATSVSSTAGFGTAERSANVYGICRSLPLSTPSSQVNKYGFVACPSGDFGQVGNYPLMIVSVQHDPRLPSASLKKRHQPTNQPTALPCRCLFPPQKINKNISPVTIFVRELAIPLLSCGITMHNAVHDYMVSYCLLSVFSLSLSCKC